MMRRRHQKVLYVIFFNRLHSFDSFTAAMLRLEIVHRHTFYIAETCHGNNRIIFRN